MVSEDFRKIPKPSRENCTIREWQMIKIGPFSHESMLVIIISKLINTKMGIGAKNRSK